MEKKKISISEEIYNEALALDIKVESLCELALADEIKRVKERNAAVSQTFTPEDLL